MSHQEEVGWGSSIAVHLCGALVATMTLSPWGPTKPAELIGQRTAAEVELVASWSRPQPPTPPVEITPCEPQVVVKPHQVHVAEQTFFRASTDVSQPTPRELAMVERLMAVPLPASEPRHSDASTEADHPPQRQVSRQTANADVAAATASTMALAPRQTSIGTTDQTLPQLLDNRPPTYPEQALIEQLEGTVVLRLHITSEGRVGSLDILTSSGHALLDAAAVRAVRAWRFAPAARAGHPVATTVRLPVRFLLDGP